MGDGACDRLGFLFGLCAFDAELDDVLDTLAVGDDLAGKGGADLGECGGECVANVGVRQIKLRFAVREETDGVVGGSVAVDADAVEGAIDGSCEQCGE